MPTAFSASGSGLAAMPAVGQHRLEAALHVDAVIAVADRLIERGQLLGMARSRRPATRLDEAFSRRRVMALIVSRDPVAGRVEEERAWRGSTATASPARRPLPGRPASTISWPLDRDMQMVLVAQMLDPVDRRRRRRAVLPWLMRRCSVRAPTVGVPAGAMPPLASRPARHEVDRRAGRAAGAT